MARSDGNQGPSLTQSWGEWFGGNLDRPARDAEEYDLHLAAHEWLLASALQINSKDDFESLRFVDVEPFDHQLQNAILFFRQLAPRGLIADDVGLGKTITAGLITTELLHRGLIESLLIVCPKGLAQQWQEELKAKFRIDARTAFGVEFDNLREYPYWITSYDTARAKMAKVIGRGFDMLICDEAHQLKNLHPGPAPMRATKFLELMKREGARFVIMLTATPIQNRLWDIFSQLEILKAPLPNPLGKPDLFKARFVADAPDARRIVKGREAEFRQRVADATIRTRRKDTGLIFPARAVEDRVLRPLADEQEFIERAQQAILTLPRLVQINYMRGLMSSPWAAAESFEKKAREGGAPGLGPNELMDLARRGRAIEQSAKVKAVLDLVKEASKQGNPRVIVFTMRLATLRHLQAALEAAGFAERVGIMSGGHDEGNARAIRDFMAEPPVRPILLASDVGAVGLNLQAGNIVVNYDLPWNPMLIEQRIGRIQRLGQKAKQVIVYNLVLRGTIEEHVVLRLMEKLSLFTQAIGEMEELLAGLGFDDEDDSTSFEARLMDLVRKSLEQKDIEADLAAMEKSRRDAEARLQEVRDRNESMLASIRPEALGTKLEGLVPSEPRIGLRDLILRCLRKGRAAVNVAEDGTLSIRDQHGRSVELRFEREGFGPSAHQSASHRVVLPGTRAFDHLTKAVREDVVHHMLDARTCPPETLHGVVASHLATLGLGVGSVREIRSRTATAWRVSAKATIQVKTDRYERLLEAEVADESHRVASLIGVEVLGAGDDAITLPRCSREHLQSAAQELVASEKYIEKATETDESFARFREFYRARYEEAASALLESVHGRGRGDGVDPIAELKRRAASDSVLRSAMEVLESRFVPRTALQPVGVQGVAYSILEVEAQAKHPHQRASHAVRMQVVPATATIVRDVPVKDDATDGEELHVCPTGHLAPAGDFVRCRVENCAAEACDECVGKLRGGQRLETCGICEQPTCLEHSAVCPNCRARVCLDHLMPLESEGSACSRCTLELDDGLRLLERDTAESAVSGRRGRRTKMVLSPISKRFCFTEEAELCEETARLLLPDEVHVDETTGRRIGVDLLEQSAASGRFGHASRMLRSALSDRPMLPSEARLCEESGCVLLPDEVGYCEATKRMVDPRLLERDAVEHKRVLRRLLVKSAVSGRYTRQQHLTPSETSGRLGLVDETVVCASCEKRILNDEVETCAESGERVCSAHLVKCEATGNRVRPDRSATCEVTGKRVGMSQLATCAESGRRALKALMIPCAATNMLTLPDALAPCAVSKQLVRRSLLSACDVTGLLAQSHLLESCSVSGRSALPTELTTCPVTGLRMIPTEAVRCAESGDLVHPSAAGTCSVTGARVNARLLGRDDVSGRLVCKRLLLECAVTGKSAVAENMGECAVTHRRVLKSELVTCGESGASLLPGEAKLCCVTGLKVHPELVVVCPDTGDVLLRSRAQVCAATGVLVSPRAVEACTATGQQVRRTELAVDEFTGHLMQASLLGRCEASGKDTLASTLRVSAVSGKRVSAALASQCEKSGQYALPSELAACARSGKMVLPALLEKCSVSGTWVLPDALVSCEATGARALPEHATVCTVSGWRVLRAQVVTSQYSGRVAREVFAKECAATGMRLLSDECFSSDLSGRTFMKDRCRTCVACAKNVDSDEGRVCGSCGQFFCRGHAGVEDCEYCDGLRRRVRGRPMTPAEVSSTRRFLPWMRRGRLEAVGRLVYVAAYSGIFSWRWRKAILVLTSSEVPAEQHVVALIPFE